MNAEFKNQRPLERRTPYHKDTSGTGFTLVEILVVISIIILFGLITLVSLHSVSVKSRDTIRIYDLKQIQLALEVYRMDIGHYPDSESEDASGWDVGNVARDSDDTFIKPLTDRRLFNKTPIESLPSMNDDYSYRYFRYAASPSICSGKSFYILAAKLERSQTAYHIADEVDSCYNDISNFWQDNFWYVIMRFE